MAIFAAPAAVGLAGKLLPFLIKAGSAAKLPLVLRTAGVVGGAAPGLMRGDLGSAVTGGALGGLTTLGLGGVTKGAQLAGARGVMKGIAAAGGTPLQVQGALTNLARVAAPVGIGLAAGRLGAGGIGGGAGNVGRGAASLAGYGTVGSEGMAAGGTPLPPGMTQYGGIAPLGDPLSVLSPLGLDAGRRLRSMKDAETLRDAQNILLPTVRKFAEQAKRDEFTRDMAGAGIRQNILTNAALTENMQRAALNMGQTAASQAGQALTARYNY